METTLTPDPNIGADFASLSPPQNASKLFRPEDLHKSDSTRSHASVKSHISVRAIGSIPLGELHVVPSPGSTEKDAVEAVIEEEPPCLDNGDVFRIVDLPANFHVGIDTIAMTTHHSLTGFRDIPAGVHFLWVQQPDGMSRCGFWFVTGEERGMARIKQWDRYNEVLGEVVCQVQYREEKTKVQSLYPSMKAYALRTPDSTTTPGVSTMGQQEPDLKHDAAAIWKRLTWAITSEFLDRVTGRSNVAEWMVDSLDGTQGEFAGSQIAASKVYVRAISSEFKFSFGRSGPDLHTLDIASETPGTYEDTTPQILPRIRDEARGETSASDVVAEMQFAFLTATHLGNLACLDHWWEMVVTVVLRAYDFAKSHPALVRDLIRTLHAQLLYTEYWVGSTTPAAEEDQGMRGQPAASWVTRGPCSDRFIFEVKPSYKARLRNALTRYKMRLNQLLGQSELAEHLALKTSLQELEQWLQTLGWDLKDPKRAKLENQGRDEEDEEDEMPVVVELDDDGREVGRISFTD